MKLFSTPSVPHLLKDCTCLIVQFFLLLVWTSIKSVNGTLWIHGCGKIFLLSIWLWPDWRRHNFIFLALSTAQNIPIQAAFGVHLHDWYTLLTHSSPQYLVDYADFINTLQFKSTEQHEEKIAFHQDVIKNTFYKPHIWAFMINYVLKSDSIILLSLYLINREASVKQTQTVGW